MSRFTVLLTTALLAAVAIGCGEDGNGGGSGSVPSGAVATVGDAEISEQDLDQQVDALARAQRRPRGSDAEGSSDGDGKQSAEDRKQLESQALSTLVIREALEQEAADRDIEVTDAEVRDRWESASQGQFKNRKALRRFLGGQTEQDLLNQLRLQMLTDRIHEQVSEEAGGGKKGAKAVEQYQEDFRERWLDNTSCREGYSAAVCADDDDPKKK